MDLKTDRRENQRFKCEVVIWHNNMLPGIFYKAKLINLSKAGIYFETDQSLYPGEKIYIAKKSDSSINNHKTFNRVEINWDKGHTKGYDHIEIKWRKELKTSSFRYGYGAVFVDSSRYLEPLLETASVNKLDNNDDKRDPRELTREQYKKEIIFSSKNQTCRGIISDISRVGAFIETEEKFPLGRLIHIEIAGDRLFKGLKLKGWVVRLEPHGFGVKFDRRTGRERRKDIDRRRGPDRRSRRMPKRRGKLVKT